jgi:hypothetical protein
MGLVSVCFLSLSRRLGCATRHVVLISRSCDVRDFALKYAQLLFRFSITLANYLVRSLFARGPRDQDTNVKASVNRNFSGLAREVRLLIPALVLPRPTFHILAYSLSFPSC